MSVAHQRAVLRPWTGPTGATRYARESAERIDRYEPEVRAFTHHDTARLRTVEDDRGGALSGMPVAVKEIIDSADHPTEWGSDRARGRRPARNADVVQRLVDAGATVAGMTTSTPFACGTTTPTRNPHALAHTPGGSSAGSGAAVGAGFVPVALATQTGASTIRPASYCGAYGLKPTHGRYPMGGVHPVAETLDDVGLIAASLQDIDRVDAVLTGGAAPEQPPDLAALRIGWVVLDGGDEAGPAAWHALELARRRLADAGARPLTGAAVDALAAFQSLVPGSTEHMFDVFAAEAARHISPHLTPPHPETDPRLIELVRRAASLTDAQIAEAHELRRRLREAHAGLTGAVDVVATLSTTGPAPVGHARTGSRTMPATPSYLGIPSVSLPVLSVDGLPLGLQLLGADGEDRRLLAAAHTIDSALRGDPFPLSARTDRQGSTS